MAKKIVLSGNYIELSEVGVGVISVYSKKNSFYSENLGAFTIKDSISNGSYTITSTEILNEDIVDETDTPFTEETLLAFLRANTGFNTASGGSGATYKSVYSLNFDGVDTTIVTVLEDNFPTPPISPSRTGIGLIDLSVDGAYAGLIVSPNHTFVDDTNWWRFRVANNSGTGFLYQESSALGAIWAPNDFVDGVNVGLNNRCVVYCEYYAPVG